MGFLVSSQPRCRRLRQNLGARCYSRAENCSSWNSSYVCSRHPPSKPSVLMSIFVWIWAAPLVWWDTWQRFCLSGNYPVRFRSRVLLRKRRSGTWVYRQRCVLSFKEKCQDIKEEMLGRRGSLLFLATNNSIKFWCQEDSVFLYPGIPPLSRWFASVTSYDHTSNCHFRRPRTPHSTDPLWIPILMFRSTFIKKKKKLE